MRSTATRTFFVRSVCSLIRRGALLALGLLVVPVVGVQAQTGPGGVGTTDGNSSLELWLKADEGVSEDGSGVDTWNDQSGNNRNASRSNGSPQLSTFDALNGKSAVTFDGDDGFSVGTNNNDALESLPESANTVFFVGRRSGTNSNGQYVLSINGDERAVGYNIQSKGTDSSFVALNKDPVFVNTPTSSFRIGSSLFTSGERLDGVLDAGKASDDDGAKTGNGGDVFLGRDDSNNNIGYLDGEIAEVIAYSGELNAAEMRIVLNYLAAKYDLSINSTYDFYGFTSGYPNDLAGLGDASSGSAPGGDTGPGVAASGSDNDPAESSILQLDGSLTDAFALFGHDGDDATSFTSNGNPPDAERLKRQWRVDLEGTSSVSFSASVDLSGVSLGSGFDDFGLIVDGDGDFTTTSDQTFYDLEDGDNDDVFDASGVTIEDGDRVAVVQIDRKVSFATTSDSKFEDTEDTPNASATVSVNYEDGSDIVVDLSTTGDLDDSDCIEDGGTDENPEGCSTGSNSNNDFEAGDGSDADDNTGTGADGTFEGDYRFEGAGDPPSRTTTVTIPGGSSSATQNIELDDDDLPEQSETFEINLDGVSAGKAGLGSSTTFNFTILDDDQERELKFADPDYTDGTESDPNYSPNSTEGDGGGSRTEKFTVKIRQDGDGETAASSSPYTKVDFSVDEEKTDANVGTDLTDPLVDVKIVDESGNDGEEYQERLSRTSGRVHFASDARESTLKLEINEDELEDADAEDIVLNLENPVSSSLVQNDSTTMTYQIEDDDTPPNVSFTSTSFSGDESGDASLDVTLDQQAGTDLAVTFEDEGSGSATRGDDYTWPSDSTISIASGKTSGTFTFTVNDDDNKEADETIDVSIVDNDDTDASLGTPSSATYTILDNDGIGSTGPGGVGTTDGSGSLALWLRADSSVHTGDDCSSEATDGDGVGCWGDLSGDNNDATQSTGSDQPALSTGQVNGNPVLQFDGADDNLRHPLEDLGNGANTVFALSSTNNTTAGDPQGIVTTAANEEDNNTNVTTRALRFPDGEDSAETFNGYNGGNRTLVTGGAPGTAASILSSIYDGTAVDLGVNGSNIDNTEETFEERGISGRIGAETEYDNNSGFIPTNFLDGDVAEAIAFTARLNTAQRNIIRNYLAARYGIALDANDLYAGDEDSGNFDWNMIGIGQDGTDDVDDVHKEAQGGGLKLRGSSLADGDYVLLGNQAEDPSTNQPDYNGLTASNLNLEARPDSVQFITVTGSPEFNLTFDFDALGFETRSMDANGYVLLHADASTCSPDAGDCDWQDAGGSVSVDGSDVTFSGVSLGEGNYYMTIGTTDATRSTLIENDWARTVKGEAGADGTDAGWRMVGVPVQGATIDDLQPAFSPGRNGFSTHSVAMDYHWSLDDGGTNTDGWTELGSGDQTPNGRGFILYLYDDQYYPLDSEIPLDVRANTGPPGDQNVTVGDGSPSFDTALNTDSTWHLLANPYAQSFDLASLNLTRDADGDSDNDFQTAVQVWDPLAGSYEIKNQGPDDVASWQAFFVERNDFDGDAAEALTFDSNGKTTGADFVGSKAGSADYRQIGFDLVAYDDSDEELARDEAAQLFFHPEASAVKDAYDATKLEPFAWSFVALAPVGVDEEGTETLRAQESRSYELEEPVEIPMEVMSSNLDPKEVVLSSRDWENVPEEWSVTLIDTKGTFDPSDDEEIEWDAETKYSFLLNRSKKAESSSEKASSDKTTKQRVPSVRSLEHNQTRNDTKTKASTDTARFVVRIEPSSESLPVELAELKARPKGESIVLNWATASEENNAGFYVEHQRLTGDTTVSSQSEDWTQREFVEGAGTTDEPQEYRHRLSDLDYGQHAFRLRQVDTDGEEHYSDVVKTEVRLDGGYEVEAPYPNPVYERATLKMAVREKQPVEVGLYDVLGRRIRTVSDEELPSQQTRRVQIDVTDLSSGVYFLRVEGDDFVETRRMTVVQ